MSHPACITAHTRNQLGPVSNSAHSIRGGRRLRLSGGFKPPLEPTAGNDLHPSIKDMLTRWRLTAATADGKVTEDVTNEGGGKGRQGSNWRRVWSMGKRLLSHCLLVDNLPSSRCNGEDHRAVPSVSGACGSSRYNGGKTVNMSVTFSSGLKVTLSFKAGKKKLAPDPRLRCFIRERLCLYESSR